MLVPVSVLVALLVLIPFVVADITFILFLFFVLLLFFVFLVLFLALALVLVLVCLRVVKLQVFFFLLCSKNHSDPVLLIFSLVLVAPTRSSTLPQSPRIPIAEKPVISNVDCHDIVVNQCRCRCRCHHDVTYCYHCEYHFC